MDIQQSCETAVKLRAVKIENSAPICPPCLTGSDLEPIGDCAVPQGSVIGDNLFLISVKDITTACNEPEYVIFADDTCIIVSADDVETLKSKQHLVTLHMSEWFSANGMLQTKLCKKTKHSQLNIITNNTIVPQVDATRYLGFVIDSGLTWSSHTDYVCDKLSAACYALSRLAPTLSPSNSRKAYFGYIHSILIEGVDLWTMSANRDRVFTIQKRAGFACESSTENR
jgi:hypothetical protein